MLFRALPVFILTASPATAHFGHAGDLAGHSHWVAIGAVAAAAAIAAVLAKRGRTKEDHAPETEADDAEETAS